MKHSRLALLVLALPALGVAQQSSSAEELNRARQYLRTRAISKATESQAPLHAILTIADGASKDNERLRINALIQLHSRLREVSPNFLIKLTKSDQPYSVRLNALTDLDFGILNGVYRPSEQLLKCIRSLEMEPGLDGMAVAMAGELRDSGSVHLISGFLDRTPVAKDRMAWYGAAHALFQIGTREATKVLADQNILYDALTSDQPTQEEERPISDGVVITTKEVLSAVALLGLIFIGWRWQIVHARKCGDE